MSLLQSVEAVLKMQVWGAELPAKPCQETDSYGSFPTQKVGSHRGPTEARKGVAGGEGDGRGPGRVAEGRWAGG